MSIWRPQSSDACAEHAHFIPACELFCEAFSAKFERDTITDDSKF